MPALYAHNRFGKQVAHRLQPELQNIVKKHYAQYQIGLQGPDLFFFYKPWASNTVSRYGNRLHQLSAMPLFEHGLKVVQEAGRDSKEYAYLLGVAGHFVLDSECHPYVEEMVEKLGVAHLEIEEEFEKMLMRMDGRDPFRWPLACLVPTDEETAKAISPFYEDPFIWEERRVIWSDQPAAPVETVRTSLQQLKLVKQLFTTPSPLRQRVTNQIMKWVGKYDTMKGLMNQLEDNLDCEETNAELFLRMQHSVNLGVLMMESLDESLQTGAPLNPRFDRTFS